ncbi:ABC-type uncharacterized transport system, periplasmic component [Candidatus Magnetobacterium bavaricum]|uniref:ABC-type uncharacterized transport system, periplasmic component n=1 Tax=Candidatus Magnetobacterium bavaricum TaxID=29290 RepID=A0A0F3GKX3_9BACT|nr:ABC-type uncharacterized transport system, periplasmic component [Candidatus Magnetobacterium bavaricum]
MKKIYINILVIIFIVEVGVMLLYFNLTKPRLLILHSYHTDYSWVRDMNVGINRVLKKKSYYFIRWHYLDTKRHPWPEYKENAGRLARKMIDKWQPDVIVAADDDAQAYVTKYYVNHPKIKIVFTGVNNDLKTYGFDKAKNVTGVLERLPLVALSDGLLTFSQRHKNMYSGKPMDDAPIRVFFIGDKSETVVGDEHWISSFNWSPIVLVGTRLVDSLPDWQNAVREASGLADYIITSNYRKVARTQGSNELVSPKELIKATVKASTIPVLGTNAFFAEDGGMLAIATSPFEQGEVATKMAVDIIDKEKSPKDIPVINSSQCVIAMNATILREKEFDVPPVYESSAMANNLYIK